MRSRFDSFASVFLSVCLMSCGGSAATSAHSLASNLSAWQVILTVKTTFTCFGSGADCGFGIAGVALDRQSNLYLTDFDDDRIFKYSISGKLVAQWGEHGSGPGQLDGPEKLAFDVQGNLYVTEVGAASIDGSMGGNNRIQKFSPTGMPLAQWGTLGSGPGQFNTPVGIAVDQQGDIYVADVANHQIQKLSSRGQPLARWQTVGSGTGERNTEIGYDLGLDASGNVYVSEPHPFGPGNDRIEKFSPAGQRLAQWGGSGSGPGQFSQPFGLTVDSKGNVFVVDTGNNRVQELSPSGQYVAQWKGPDSGFVPTSKVAVDDQGNMYVSIGNQVLKLVVR
jgi:tripartite motif-containing protein 71